MTMNKKIEDYLSAEQKELLSFSNNSVRILDNLEFAISSGLLILKDNGQLDWPPQKKSDLKQNRQYHAIHHPINRRICLFNNKFLYKLAYRETCIPFGCKDCFKVKVIPQTFIELTNLFEITKDLYFTSKFGYELRNRLNRSSPYQYAAYFYFVGLEEAKKAYTTISEIIDTSPDIKMNIKTLIKRGCTHFEIKFGPSNKWTFNPVFEAIESLIESFYHGTCRRTEPIKENENMLEFSEKWLFLASHAVNENNIVDEDDDGKKPAVVTYHDNDENEIFL